MLQIKNIVLLLLVTKILAQGDFAILDLEVAAVSEDPNFDFYNDIQRGVGSDADLHSKANSVENFDFDPSEGLTFYMAGKSSECFYEDTKFDGDELGGAYMAISADSHIDMEVKNSEGVMIYRRFGDAEGQYLVTPKQTGVFELCFINTDSESKLVTHVTNTLKSQHPVQKEHVNVLAKYASHLDVRLGELESEQRLQLIRIDRHMKVEERMNKRVILNGTLECIVYLAVCFFQVYYIKSLLSSPYIARSWV